MKYLIYFFMAPLFTSCSTNKSSQFIVDTDINISIKDSEGNDLLNPAYPDSYQKGNIKLFHIINGEQIEIFDANMNYPKGFFIYKHENEYRIRVFPNTDKSEQQLITLIKWNETDTDTIRCNVERTSNSEICRKVWFNNEVVWEAYETERFFEILK